MTMLGRCAEGVKYGVKLVAVVTIMLVMKLFAFIFTGFGLTPLLRPISPYPSDDANKPDSPKLPWWGGASKLNPGLKPPGFKGSTSSIYNSAFNLNLVSELAPLHRGSPSS